MAATRAVKNIIRNGDKQTKEAKAFGLVTEYKLKNGTGVSFDAKTNKFIGFLGRGV